MASGVTVHATNLTNAARCFAALLEVPDFHASAGWLYKFYRQHDISSRHVTVKRASADAAAVQQFQERLCSIVEENDSKSYELYNADEACLYWKSLPTYTVSSKHESITPGMKASKQHVSVLLCFNAEGSHKLRPMVVGDAKQPQVLRNCMDHLPVLWRANKKAWFTQEIVRQGFDYVFVSSVRSFQTQEKGSQDVKYEQCYFLLMHYPTAARRSYVVVMAGLG